jgi:diguanylate cyclase (GGDEF)-like protein
MYKVKGNDDLFAIYVLRDIAFKVINEDNTRKNEDIVRILANEYATVLYVDVLTGVVSSCKLPKSWDASLKKDISDKPFTEVWRKYIKLYVKNSDAEKMSKLLDKEYMTQYFENKTNLSFVFRMGTESEFKYYELKVVKANEGDLKALVVGMADKDEEIRSANEMQKQLETALVLAQNDALTNVRNRTGYDMCERQINAELEKGNADGFAVIMFDVNGLKMVNDAYGHDKGDQMLINACKIICDVFKHSSVFRLGGDEFVAVVRGKDYDKCNSLLQKLRDIVTENEEKDGPAYENVSMASGMAIYNPKIDKYVYDVFMRADEAMYENKNHMKVLRAKRNLQRRNRG